MKVESTTTRKASNLVIPITVALTASIVGLILISNNSPSVPTPASRSSQPPQHLPNQPTPGQSNGIPSVANLVEGLATRLHAEPDDAGGWLLLAKSYHHLGRTAEAQRAYGKATALGRTDPQLDQILNGNDSADLAFVSEFLGEQGPGRN